MTWILPAGHEDWHASQSFRVRVMESRALCQQGISQRNRVKRDPMRSTIGLILMIMSRIIFAV